jgi:hypothetical protein
MPPNKDNSKSAAISAIEADDVDLDQLLNTINLSPESILTAPPSSPRQLVSSSGPKPILKRVSSFLAQDENQAQTFSPNNQGSLGMSSSSIDTSVSSRVSSRMGGNNMRRTSSQVSFKNVEVREYDRTLGDNPSCMSGPPIQLDWSYSKESEICMEEYEKTKSMRRRRNRNVIRMGKAKRLDLLQNHLGYSQEEISAATKAKKDIQRARSMTNLTSSFWRVEDVAQSASRKLKRALKKGHGSEGNLGGLGESTSSTISNNTLDASNSSLEPTLFI